MMEGLYIPSVHLIIIWKINFSGIFLKIQKYALEVGGPKAKQQ